MPRFAARPRSTVAPLLTLPEAQLALAALGSVRAGDREVVVVLRRLVRRRPTVVRPLG